MKKILAIGPHPDDIELGCFGTMCRLASEGHKVHFLVLTRGEGGHESGDRMKEAMESASLLDCELIVEGLPDRHLSEGLETIEVIEKYVREIGPDIVFLPSKNDTHQDHRAAHLASIVATRKVKEVYIYQSPSTTIDFRPTVYFDITDYIEKKIEAVRIHTSQSGKIYMADKAVRGLAEYRAFDVLENGRLFEAFELYRSIQ